MWLYVEELQLSLLNRRKRRQGGVTFIPLQRIYFHDWLVWSVFTHQPDGGYQSADVCSILALRRSGDAWSGRSVCPYCSCHAAIIAFSVTSDRVMQACWLPDWSPCLIGRVLLWAFPFHWSNETLFYTEPKLQISMCRTAHSSFLQNNSWVCIYSCMHIYA